MVSEYRTQNRGGKGLIDIQTEGRNGPVVEALAVTSESGLMLITSGGKIIRTSAQDVSVIGRNTRGVTLIDLEADEKVLAVSPVLVESNSNGAVVEETPSTDDTIGNPTPEQ